MINVEKDFRNFFLIAFCLTICIIIVYGQVGTFDFIGFDDPEYVTENEYVQEGLNFDSFIWAFTTFHSANWHPLTWLSHMLDCQFYGMDPMGHHWTNVQFHLANTLLLFFILFKMTGARFKSAFVAALFALHPLHVESVAWVSERKDVLSTFFGLLMIFAYYRYIKISNCKNYFFVIICFILGLMAKPMLVTFPFVLLLLDFWPLERFQYKGNYILNSKSSIGYGYKGIGTLFLEKTPLFVLVVISSTLTFLAQKSHGAVEALEALSLQIRIENALVSYARYVLKAIWPSNLAVFYPYQGGALSSWQIFGAAFLILTACFFAVRISKKYPYVPVGIFWYLGTLVPVIGLVQVGEQAMADRYTYIPSIGLFIVVSWGVPDLLNKWKYKKLILGLAALAILFGCVIASFIQIRYWKNGVALFEHTVKVTENNYRAQNDLGTAWEAINLDQAILHYKQALEIKPNYLLAIYNLGVAYCEKEEYDEAILNFKKVLKIDPQNIDARMNLANVLFLLDKPDEAVFHYDKIIKADSKNSDAHYNLAYLLSKQGKFDEAVSHYEESLKFNPKYSKAHYNLGNILLKQGKTEEAFTHFSEAIKINPDYAQGFNKIGEILFKQGKIDRAKVFFSKAIEIDPNDKEARKNLGVVNQALKTANP